MTTARRTLTSATLIGLVLSTAACVPDGLDASPKSPTSAPASHPVPPRTTSPTTTPTGPTTPPTAPGGTSTPGSVTTGTAAPTTAPPAEALDPCPTADDLNFTFTATDLGTHAASGNALIEVHVAYTNPLPHPMWLMGSLGYLDAGGNDQFLYYTPGGLPFEDQFLTPGKGELVVRFEDTVGTATESEIYLSYWALASTPAGSSDPPTCAPTRGIFEPPPIPDGDESD